jgi:hypothetical protein
MKVVALTDNDSPWHSFWIRFGQYAPFLQLPTPLTLTTDARAIASLEQGDVLLLYRYNRAWGDLEAQLRLAGARGVRLCADVDDDLWHAPGWPKERLVPYSRCLRHCHTITCSTKPLQELLQVMFPCTTVHLLRNSTPPRQQPSTASDNLTTNQGLVHLLWTGAAWTRPHDLALLRPLAQWATAWPETFRWRHIGHRPEQLGLAEALGIDPGLVDTLPLMSHQQYLEALDGSIGLAPLAPGCFNGFKSELKLLEYSGIAMPWVASAAQPYRDLCERWGWNGRLCTQPHHWIEHVEALVDPERRRREGQALQTLAHTNQSHSQAVAAWQSLLSPI